MSGLGVDKTQHLDHADNVLDASLWLWPFLRPEMMKDHMQQHSVTVLESLSIAIFLGNAAAWISLSRVSRRFRWISRQWCTKCQDFAPGRIRKYTYHESDLAVEILMQRECCKCQVEMFKRLVHQEEDPAE